MTDEPDPEGREDDHVDPLDREAADIDARSEEVPEEIEELIEHARLLGHDAPGEGATPN